ncbi:MAG: SBBP repeat-containing protein [Promethearchaeota archaeon]
MSEEIIKNHLKKRVFTTFGIIVLMLFGFIFINNYDSKKTEIFLNEKTSSFLVGFPENYYTWGGSGDDCGNGVAIGEWSHFFVAGYTESIPSMNKDLCLVEFNSEFAENYYTWGGSGDDSGNAIALYGSGDVYVAGYTESFGAFNKDLCLVNFGYAGVDWNYTWGGSGDDCGNGVALDESGNAYVAGYTNSFGKISKDLCLVKFNSTGVEWNYTWGGSGDDCGNAVALDESGNAYVVGYTNSYGKINKDLCLVKFNSTGVEWNYTWGGGGNDCGNGVALDVSGNPYITGYTESFGAVNKDLCLVKFNSLGVEWNYTWGGDGDDCGNGVVLDTLGYAYITGVSNSWTLYSDHILFMRYHPTEQIWTQFIGEGCGNGLVLNPSNDPYIIGYTENYGAIGCDMILIRFNIYTYEELFPKQEPYIFFLILLGTIFGLTEILTIILFGIILIRSKKTGRKPTRA